MSEVAALVRAGWLSAISYRVGMAMSVAGLVIMVLPTYFVAEALQPVMAEAIESEASQFFAFVIVGLIASHFVVAAVSTLPNAVRSGIGDGTLEALLSTRASLPGILSGLIGYPIIWAAVKAFVILLVGLTLGMQVAWSHALIASGILLMILLAYLPFGLLGAAMVFAVRTAGPIPQGLVMLSSFLGGVYYPTHVIPTWLQHVSNLLPLTYGLRALRRTLLEGMPLSAISMDLMVLSLFVVVPLLAASVALRMALGYSRRAGTLAQY